MSAAGEDAVLIRTDGRMGHITLNRPRALNALTLEMVRAIDDALTDWEQDNAIALVLIDGAGSRGLCAGGDIRALYEASVAGDISVASSFFYHEYRLNARIAAYRKPYVAFMDGIVMGGGVGLSAHGSHRIVTERTRLAMPETSIGFFPDVGGTWLLGRAPDGLGRHAALTSYQMSAADSILCGLADFCVAAADLPALAQALTHCGSAGMVRSCIDAYAIAPPDGALATARDWVAACYPHDSVEAIVAALQAHPDPAADQAAREIAQKSPTSLKVTLRALREAAAAKSLNACLEQEYRLALHAILSPDFREGVRAAVVDKDKNPSFVPATLALVDDARVQAFFDAPDHGGLGLVQERS